MKKIFRISLIAIVVIILIITVVSVLMTRGLSDIQAMVISEVNLNQLDDGTYTGNFDGGRWSNQTDIEIKDHKITDIRIVKDIKFPMEDVANKIFNQVIQQQNTAVDVVSGATVTSKAYLKSLEDALLSR